MKFTLIICTYNRSDALLKLMISVEQQKVYPNEIIIIDGSSNNQTYDLFSNRCFKNAIYFKVLTEQRGLTKQRNIGISKVDSSSEVVCFLDDDTILDVYYFQKILKTYIDYPKALGVGGYISNETKWEIMDENFFTDYNEFMYDGWTRAESKRFLWRKKLGLDSNRPPGFSPLFSHGRSIGFLPPSGKVYPAEQLMGGVSSFRRSVFSDHQFSNYFEGYGLYEDADFCIRVAKSGLLLVNTSAKLEHHHDIEGRPNNYNYGKMVVRNGFYVWRVKNPRPNIVHVLKWNSITILLIFIRFTNILTTKQRREAFYESLGRLVGWFSLLVDRPH